MSVASTAQQPIPSANEPIVSTDQAISLFAAAISHPLADEIVAFLIDGCNRANTIVVVSGTEQPDDVIEVAEIMAMTGTLIGLGLIATPPGEAPRETLIYTPRKEASHGQ